MKRIIVALIFTILLILMVSLDAFASSTKMELNITTNIDSCKPGDNVKVTVSLKDIPMALSALKKGTNGILGLNFKLNYDTAVFTAPQLSNPQNFTKLSKTMPVEFVIEMNTVDSGDNKGIYLLGCDDTASNHTLTTENQDLVSFYLTVKANAPGGSSTLSFEPTDTAFCDIQLNEISSEKYILGSKTVTIKSAGKSGDDSVTPVNPSKPSSADSPATSANPSSQPKGFTDLKGYEWAKPSIDAMSIKGFINGTGGTNFSPAGILTRAETAALLVRMFKYRPANSQLPFKDVDVRAWYYNDLKTAYDNGLIKGIDNDHFKPGGLVTRAQIAAITARILKERKIDVNTANTIAFNDDEKLPIWALNDIRLVTSAGIIQGKNGSFCPNDTLTRAETAVILNNLSNYCKM